MMIYIGLWIIEDDGYYVDQERKKIITIPSTIIWINTYKEISIDYTIHKLK